MTASPIKHILFDLGGTLMHTIGDWDPIQERADKALGDKLLEYDIELDVKKFRSRLDEYYDQRNKDNQETTYHLVLRELLRELDYAIVAEEIIRSALDAMYSVTQTNWQLEADALSTLEKLKSEKYDMGIFSNAGDDKDVQDLIDGFGIRSYFDFVLTSAGSFYRKPHPRAFEIALARWNIEPNEAVMIGDNLEADILGAGSIGMHTVWITRRAEFKEEDIRRFNPDFSVRKLTELPPTLERISNFQA